VRLRARARDQAFRPLDNAVVRIEVIGADGRHVALHAEPSLDAPGVFEADYIPRTDGGYRASAVVTDLEGKTIGDAVAGWATDRAADEFRDLRPKREPLERITAATGGRIVEASDLAAFAARLHQQPVPVTDPWLRPLWHGPIIFILAILCFVAEWGLRRWRGLP